MSAIPLAGLAIAAALFGAYLSTRRTAPGEQARREPYLASPPIAIAPEHEGPRREPRSSQG